MKSFIRETSVIIIEKLTSNSVLDALYQESIITTEEYEDIQPLDVMINRRKLIKFLSTKNNSSIDKFIEIVESNTAGQEDLIQKLKEARDNLNATGIEPPIRKHKKVEGMWFGNLTLTVPSNFTGRIKELQKLHEIVLNSHNSVPANCDAIALLSGLSGIGKTTLARQYAFQYQRFFDGNIIWLRSEDPKLLEEDFRALAKDYLNIDEEDINKLVREVYIYFKNKNSLFIFDNVEDSAHIRPFLPNKLPPSTHTQRPYLLATGKKKDLFANDDHVFVLDILDKDEAVKLITKSLPKSNLNESKLLAEKLGYFPLAIQQAVAYIRHLSNNSIALYFVDYKENAKAVLSEEKFSKLTDYEKSTFITFNITKEKILEECSEHVELAENLLNCIAYSLPGFRSRIRLRHYSHLKKCSERETLFCLSRFAAYSLISLERELGDIFLIPPMHRLLQHVIRLSNANELVFLRQIFPTGPQLCEVGWLYYDTKDFYASMYRVVPDAIAHRDELYFEFPRLYQSGFANGMFPAELHELIIDKFKYFWGEHHVYTVKFLYSYFKVKGELQKLFEPLSKLLDPSNCDLKGPELELALNVGHDYIQKSYVEPDSAMEICDKLISVIQALDKHNIELLKKVLNIKYGILSSVGKASEAKICQDLLLKADKREEEIYAAGLTLIRSLKIFGGSDEQLKHFRSIFTVRNKPILKDILDIQDKLSPDLPTIALEVHLKVKCNYCKKSPLLCRRFKCNECLDFGFCEDCYNNYKAKPQCHFQGNHNFQKVKSEIKILLEYKEA